MEVVHIAYELCYFGFVITSNLTGMYVVHLVYRIKSKETAGVVDSLLLASVYIVFLMSNHIGRGYLLSSNLRSCSN